VFSVFSKLVAPVFDRSILLHIWSRYKFNFEEFNEVLNIDRTEKTRCVFFFTPSLDLN